MGLMRIMRIERTRMTILWGRHWTGTWEDIIIQCQLPILYGCLVGSLVSVHFPCTWLHFCSDGNRTFLDLKRIWNNGWHYRSHQIFKAIGHKHKHTCTATLLPCDYTHYNFSTNHRFLPNFYPKNLLMTQAGK